MMDLINPHIFCLHQQRFGCGAGGGGGGTCLACRVAPASLPPRRLVPRGEQTGGRWIIASFSPCVWPCFKEEAETNPV